MMVMRVAVGTVVCAFALSGCGVGEWIMSPVTPDLPTPTAVGNKDWGKLNVGDCVSDDVSQSTIAGRATLVQCAGGKAMAELVATSAPDASQATQPKSQTKDAVDAWCQAAFESYLGIKANKSLYKIYWIDSGGNMDNIQCFAASDQPLRRSLKNVKQ